MRSIKYISTAKEIIHLYNDLTLGKYVVHYFPHNNRSEYTTRFSDLGQAEALVESLLKK